MTNKALRNRQFLADLFAGPFRGHAITMDAPAEYAVSQPPEFRGDLSCSDRPVSEWVEWGMRDFEAKARWDSEIDDDNVLSIRVGTGTQLFAEAFGSPVAYAPGSNAFALPCVDTPEAADALPEPSLDARPLARVFEYAEAMSERVGPGVPVSVPDIQSPFDIAALVWKKESLFVAMIDKPDAVKRLVGKCQSLLTRFLKELKRRFPDCNLCHCPNAWAPPELGCWMSEDEAGAMSVAMFEEFCLPSLIEMSQDFGGMFVHCCATADHQYGGFKRIPNLRGINRVFQTPGPKPAVEAFSGATVLMMAWMTEAQIAELLQIALPDTRYLFNTGAATADEAKRLYEWLRERCPRS